MPADQSGTTPEKAAEAIKLLLKGMPPSKVAQAIGVGKSTIYSRMAGEWAPELQAGAGK